MRSLNARTDLFELVFPILMFPTEVCEKYNTLLSQQKWVIHDIQETIQESVQEVNIGAPSFDVLEQDHKAIDNSYRKTGQRSMIHSNELFENRVITVTFRYTDALINYFFLFESYINRYSKATKEKTLGDMIIMTYDSSELRHFQMTFKGIIATNIDELNLAYNVGARDFKTFTMSFYWNDISVAIDFPEPKDNYS